MYSNLPDILLVDGAKQQITADCQALVDLALGSSAGSTRCSTSPRRGRRLPAA